MKPNLTFLSALATKTASYLILIVLVMLAKYSVAQYDYTGSYDDSGNRTGFNVIILKSAEIQNDELDTIAATNNTDIEDEKVFEEEIEDVKVIIYPNPTAGKLTVKIQSDFYTNSTYKFIVYSTGGLVAKSGLMNIPTHDIDLTANAAGIYYLKIFLDNGKVSEWKIIKQ